jgi:PIN domain nuclease of toxin-antitoxin system
VTTATAVVADTHTFIWYVEDSPRLSRNALDALEAATAAGLPILVSAISFVELVYLVEKGKIAQDVFSTLITEVRSEESAIDVHPIDLTVVEAMPKVPRSDIPDMPDRIIAATGVALGVPVVTKDSDIRQSSVATIW